MKESNSFYLLSLGCSKNTVDSESMAQLLDDAGYGRTDDPARAQALIVNTCGFIGPAREESMQALRKLADAKQPWQQLIATGCLSQRYGAQLIREAPGIDGILSTRRWMDIVDLTQRLRSGKITKPIYHLPESPTVGRDEHGVMRVAVQGGSAYLKIADGCRRPCARRRGSCRGDPADHQLRPSPATAGRRVPPRPRCPGGVGPGQRLCRAGAGRSPHRST